MLLQWLQEKITFKKNLMLFIEDNLESILHHVNQISADTKPEWGAMTSQKMIEHLTDAVRISSGKIKFECLNEGDRLQRSRDFLMSDAPMPKGFKAVYVADDAPYRNEEFELAVDELVEAWVDFEEYYETNPKAKPTHPVFGDLTLSEWKWMHRKHFTHHLTQFGVQIERLEHLED